MNELARLIAQAAVAAAHEVVGEYEAARTRELAELAGRLDESREQIDELRRDFAQRELAAAPIRWAGTWEADRTYHTGELVMRHGSSWFCTAAVSEEPPADGWQLLAQRGQRGRGEGVRARAAPCRRARAGQADAREARAGWSRCRRAPRPCSSTSCWTWRTRRRSRRRFQTARPRPLRRCPPAAATPRRRSRRPGRRALCCN